MKKPIFKEGYLVRKRLPCHPERRIGTVIKSEIWNRKRKDREKPDQILYYEVLWRGHTRTDWIPHQRLERVEGI